ncbi:MAG: copper oxidase [candidate division NC10 bacterium]|nr:copper oxidase [candidate division NC10 bacterium]
MPGHEAMPGMQPTAPQEAGTRDPGHAMTMDDPMESPIPDEGVPRATATKGMQALAFKTVDGVKVFELTARPVKWLILPKSENLPDVWATAWTYNGQVPGPMIRVRQGDRVRVVLRNELPEETSIHWHGMRLPNAMDGVAHPAITQQPVPPGGSFTYEFTARDAGTFFYHTHVREDRQLLAGLAGPLIVDPRRVRSKVALDYTVMLQEWRINPQTGRTWPAMPVMAEPNFFTINGKAFPSTEVLEVKKGARVRLRFIGAGQFVHPMHVHGFPFKIVATDGHPVPVAAQLTKDTVNVAPGERYDVEFTADEPGTWIVHCHIPHHMTNAHASPGGLLFALRVAE